MQSLLQSHPAPRAIFAASDLLAVGVLRALHEAGLSVPGDVAIVSFDGSVESDYSWPPLTSVRQRIATIAESALQSALDTTPSPHVSQQLHGDLIVRASCGCPSQAPLPHLDGPADAASERR